MRSQKVQLRVIQQRGESGTAFEGGDLRGLGQDPVLKGFTPQGGLRVRLHPGVPWPSAEITALGFTRQAGASGTECVLRAENPAWTHSMQLVRLFLLYSHLARLGAVQAGALFCELPSLPDLPHPVNGTGVAVEPLASSVESLRVDIAAETILGHLGVRATRAGVFAHSEVFKHAEQLGSVKRSEQGRRAA